MTMYTKQHFFDMAKLIAQTSSNMLLDKEQHTALINNFVEHFATDNPRFRPEQFRQEIQLQSFMLFHQIPAEDRAKARRKILKIANWC